MNIQRIKALRTFIAKLPAEHFDMSTWICISTGFKQTIGEAAKLSCGTTACLAGWAILKFYPNREDKIQYNADTGLIVVDHQGEELILQTVAAQLLDLTKGEAYKLFTGDWSIETNKMFLTEITKEDVIKELDYIIVTGSI